MNDKYVGFSFFFWSHQDFTSPDQLVQTQKQETDTTPKYHPAFPQHTHTPPMYGTRNWYLSCMYSKAGTFPGQLIYCTPQKNQTQFLKAEILILFKRKNL